MNQFYSQSIEKLIEAIGDNNESLIVEIIEDYLEDTPEIIEKLTIAVKERELKNIHLFAHTLKSSTVLFGINPLASLCDTLEKQAKYDNVSDSILLLEQIEKEYKTFTDILIRLKPSTSISK